GVDAHSMLNSGAGRDSSRAAVESESPARQCQEAKPSPASPGPARSSAAVRFATPDSLDEYLAGTGLKCAPVSAHAALEESLFLGLRLNRGANLHQLATQFGEHALAALAGTFAELLASGLLEQDSTTIRLTPRGRLLSNEVFEKFITVSV
ncbi:MAG TPA: hypothetical protein VGF06_04695, partial [Terriglobales bacterium]